VLAGEVRQVTFLYIPQNLAGTADTHTSILCSVCPDLDFSHQRYTYFDCQLTFLGYKARNLISCESSMYCNIKSVNICSSSKGNVRSVGSQMRVTERRLAAGGVGLVLTCAEEEIVGTGERGTGEARIYQRQADVFLTPDEVHQIVDAAARIGIRCESSVTDGRQGLTLVKK
jgi:hypothetical protein